MIVNGAISGSNGGGLCCYYYYLRWPQNYGTRYFSRTELLNQLQAFPSRNTYCGIVTPFTLQFNFVHGEYVLCLHVRVHVHAHLSVREEILNLLPPSPAP